MNMHNGVRFWKFFLYFVDGSSDGFAFLPEVYVVHMWLAVATPQHGLVNIDMNVGRKSLWMPGLSLAL